MCDGYVILFFSSMFVELQTTPYEYHMKIGKMRFSFLTIDYFRFNIPVESMVQLQHVCTPQHVHYM